MSGRGQVLITVFLVKEGAIVSAVLACLAAALFLLLLALPFLLLLAALAKLSTLRGTPPARRAKVKLVNDMVPPPLSFPSSPFSPAPSCVCMWGASRAEMEQRRRMCGVCVCVWCVCVRKDGERRGGGGGQVYYTNEAVAFGVH
eukprot:2081938-Rhodomonas_salina.1